MSQHFKSKYDQMRENGSYTALNPDDQSLERNELVRNIHFVLEDGSQQFLNYGYLVCGTIDANKKIISLKFTTHEVQIIGFNLNSLFEKISMNRIYIIKISEKRYEEISEGSDFKIDSIEIKMASNY